MQPGKHNSEEFLYLPFKDLKKLLKKKNRKEKVPEKSANRKTIAQNKLASTSARNDRDAHYHERTHDDYVTDQAVFHNAMKEVQEIREFRDIPIQQRKTSSTCKYKTTSSDQEALKSLEELVKGRGMINLPDTQEYIEWIDQDYRDDIIKKLHKGQYSVQDCLDLHGIILEDAEREVERFFKAAIKKGFRCIKIIHGRGLRSVKGPVLKKSLTAWLLGRYRKKIIAFVTARQCDGGLGALYVLLR